MNSFILFVLLVLAKIYNTMTIIQMSPFIKFSFLNRYRIKKSCENVTLKNSSQVYKFKKVLLKVAFLAKLLIIKVITFNNKKSVLFSGNTFI